VRERSEIESGGHCYLIMNKTSFFTKILALSLLTGSLAIATVPVAEEAAFDVRPVPVKTPPPDFPFDMKRNGVSGVVAVRVVIDETGSVADCTVSKSSHEEFEAPAIRAVKGWKFKPATKGGVAVKVSVVIPIKFSVET
jgi:periplasmic protein TonB